jgi:hypothetical protein
VLGVSISSNAGHSFVCRHSNELSIGLVAYKWTGSGEQKLYHISISLVSTINIASISLNVRPVLVVEEAERTTDHGQATGKLYHLLLRVECTHFVIYKAGREPTPY